MFLDSEGNDAELYRITGPTAVMQHIASLALPNHHYTTKKHHVEGVGCAHLFLKRDELTSFQHSVLIERVSNILTSTAQRYQVTLRDSQADAAKLLAVGLAVQAAGGFAFLRAQGTLRVTLVEEYSKTLDATLRKQHSTFKIYSDTPLTAWAADREGNGPAAPKAAKKVDSEPVKKAREEGKIVVKIASDFLPHPALFGQVAASLGWNLSK
jgi:hypothetical protein